MWLGKRLRFWDILGYVGDLRFGVRHPPTFEHSLWNVYDRVVNNLPRTTNALEGWHNAFARSVGHAHASIWKFIETLKKEHARVHLSITQHANYMTVPKRKVKYTNINI